MTFSMIKHDSTRAVLAELSQDIRRKFAHPAVPHAVHDFFGVEELHILSRAILEISYVDTLKAGGMEPDGNWLEFTQWTGLTNEDMAVIRDLMTKHGYTGHEQEVF